MAVKELCRWHGFSEASYYLWRSKFGGMSVSDATSLLQARTVIETWRREYNEERPKQLLGGLTPAAYAKQLTTQLP